MRVVLFGDIHVYRLALAPWHLLSKRVLGQSNLVFNRRKKFDHALLPGLIQKAIDLEPNLLLLSGDLTTTALKPEFRDAAAALRPLTDQVPAIAVPGNHDRYTYASARSQRMDRMLSQWVPSSFPFTRELNASWNLLALDGAAPHPFNARGRLGQAQLDQAQRIIDAQEPDKGLVVLCHYPCALPGGIHEHDSHALRERDELREALTRCRARVVYMHGHIHKPWHHEPGDGSGVPFTCIDAGSPCMISRAYPTGQGFYEIELPDNPRGPLAVTHHTAATGA